MSLYDFLSVSPGILTLLQVNCHLPDSSFQVLLQQPSQLETQVDQLHGVFCTIQVACQ